MGGYVIIEYAPQENAIYIHKDCKYYSFTEDELLFELFIQVGNNLQTLQAHYLEQKKLGIRKVPSLTGWTSWYYHYTHINQKIIEQNLRAFQPYPIDLFQIDDGWQQAVGDWQVNSKRFPDGMKKLADAIHIQGYKAGLWLAPLVCEPKSKIFQAHKDWLLIDDKGKPIRAGFNPLWGGWLRPWFYALDIHNPQVQGYLRKVLFQILENWQFDLVKLDFLYAATLAPQRNRYTEMEFAIQFLRECVGNKWILACGVPLANAYHHVEYCRIGADVSLRWDTPILAQLGARERISTFSTLVATLYRQFLNGKLFYNDPDVFILRKQANHLTKYEKQTLLLLNSLAGGLVLTSDNPAEYDLETDQLFKRLFPHCIKTIVQIEESDLLFKIMCEAGAFNYTIYANLSNKKRSITLESQFYYDSMADRHYAPDTKLVLVQHQSIGLLNINISNEAPSFAGSQSHLFAGLELIECNICGHKIRLSVHKQAFPNAKYYFFIPEKNSGILINGGMLETKDLAILKPFQLKLGIWQNSSK